MLTYFTFIVITLVTIGLFHLANPGSKVVLIFFLVWGSAVSILAYWGFFKVLDTFPPRILFVLIPITLYVIFFYRRVNIPLSKTNYLLAIHSLRLPVEIVLYSLFIQGKIPIIMTFEGWNYDILIGISAILLLLYSFFSKKQLPKQLFLVWNILGLIFLATIVIIAILSVPLPIQQFGFKQPNVAVLAFPYVLLPAIVVPIVLLAHLLGLKVLRSAK